MPVDVRLCAIGDRPGPTTGTRADFSCPTRLAGIDRQYGRRRLPRGVPRCSVKRTNNAAVRTINTFDRPVNRWKRSLSRFADPSVPGNVFSAGPLAMVATGRTFLSYIWCTFFCFLVTDTGFLRPYFSPRSTTINSVGDVRLVTVIRSLFQRFVAFEILHIYIYYDEVNRSCSWYYIRSV